MVKTTCTTMLLFVMINDYPLIVAVPFAFVIYCVSNCMRYLPGLAAKVLSVGIVFIVAVMRI